MVDPIPEILQISAESCVLDTKGWPCCDVDLMGFEWIPDICGVELKLRVPNLDQYLLMTCDWISRVNIELDTEKPNRNNAAPPMTWEVTYTKSEDNRWILHFDFASDGQLDLECGSVALKVSSKKCS